MAKGEEMDINKWKSGKGYYTFTDSRCDLILYSYNELQKKVFIHTYSADEIKKFSPVKGNKDVTLSAKNLFLMYNRGSGSEEDKKHLFKVESVKNGVKRVLYDIEKPEFKNWTVIK